MNVALAKSLVALGPASVLLCGATILLFKTKTMAASLQALGAACLAVVALTHVAEALAVFPAMRWGFPDSAGHYLDAGSIVLGLVLFPVGYLWQVLAEPRGQKTSLQSNWSVSSSPGPSDFHP